MNLKNFWHNFLENKINLFILKYLLFLKRLYYQVLSPFKYDIKTIINHYILRRKIKPLLKGPKFPEFLTVIPTNICNANCVFCVYRLLDHKKEIMQFETFKKVIDEFIALGGKHLELSPTLGDVLINKTFFSLVRYAKKKGVYIRMFTNGILLKKNENFKEVINSGIDDIVISTGDLIPKYEAEILGISQELASQKIEGLLKLLEYKEKTKSNIKITIGFRAKRSFKEIWNTIQNSEFKRFFDKRIFKIDYAFRYDNWCGKISKKDLLGVMRLRRRPILRKYPCSSLWNVSVLANGDLRLCGCRVKETEHDELVIGNVLTESLSEIINNKKGQKILSDWMIGEIIETCEDCRRYGFPKYFKKFK